MAFDTYSPNLGILLPGTGNDAGTWGTYTNNNLGTLIEEAIGGSAVITFNNGSQGLSMVNGATCNARKMILICEGTLGGATTYLYVPYIRKLYFITNHTTDNHVLTVATSGTSASVQIPNGRTVAVYCDSKDVYSAIDYISGAFNGTATGTFIGNLTGNVTGNVTGNLTGGVAGNVTGNVSGTAGALSPGNTINGVLFNGTQPITITATAAANNLTGTTLAANVVNSSLTSIGTLTAGQVPVARLTGNFPANANGLATVATSGSASDLATGTLPTARLPGGALRQASLGSGVVTVQSGGSPTGGADGDIFLIY